MMIQTLISFAFLMATGYLMVKLLPNAKKMDKIEIITLSFAFSVALYPLILFVSSVYLGIPISLVTLLAFLILLIMLIFKSKHL
jgi:uncharacterized membrane protein